MKEDLLKKGIANKIMRSPAVDGRIYHIEADSTVVLVQAPNQDRLPPQYISNLHGEISEEVFINKTRAFKDVQITNMRSKMKKTFGSQVRNKITE